MDFSGVYVGPEVNNYKTYGFPVHYIAKKTNSSTLFPFSLPYSGRIGRASGANTLWSSRGTFWTDESFSTVGANSLDFYEGGNIFLELNDMKTSGGSVRCVAKKQKKTNPSTLFPFSLPYSGNTRATSGDNVNHGTLGSFWLNRINSDTLAGRLTIFETDSISPQSASSRTNGFSVRCVDKKIANHKALAQNNQFPSLYSHSRFRTQGASIAIMALTPTRAHLAVYGLAEPILPSMPDTLIFVVATSGQMAPVVLKLLDSLSAASP